MPKFLVYVESQTDFLPEINIKKVTKPLSISKVKIYSVQARTSDAAGQIVEAMKKGEIIQIQEIKYS